MKKLFKHYFPLTDEELKGLWENCTFVVDTNVLLNMYRYSKNTRTQYLQIFKSLSKQGRIWLPYQVSFEFFANRLNVLGINKKQYGVICKSLRDTIEQTRKVKNHPLIDLEEIEDDINQLIIKIEDQEREHPNLDGDMDAILSEITDIFDGKVGAGFTKDELKEIEKEGEKRYKEKIPPGFEDNSKSDNKYGDLILWKEILKLSKETMKGIIFITDDNKKDWWLIDDGKRLMPLPDLRKEIFDESGQDIHIYTPESFIKHIEDSSIGKDIIDFKLDESSIEEIKKVGENSGYGIGYFDLEEIKKYFSEISGNLSDELMLEIEYTDITNLLGIKKSINELDTKKSSLDFLNNVLGLTSSYLEMLNYIKGKYENKAKLKLRIEEASNNIRLFEKKLLLLKERVDEIDYLINFG